MAAYDVLFKLLLVGESGAGKTSLLLRFAQGEFVEAKNTVGVDVKVKTIKLEGKNIKLTIWDTAGQERFRTLTSSYYRGAQGIILVYDISNRESFTNIQQWLQEVDIYCTNADVVKILIGNKSDKESERVVSTKEGREFARSQAMLFMEASAKTEENVKAAFEELVLKMLQSPSLQKPSEKRASLGDAQQGPGGESPYCC